jgi:hypothetical protein
MAKPMPELQSPVQVMRPATTLVSIGD